MCEMFVDGNSFACCLLPSGKESNIMERDIAALGTMLKFADVFQNFRPVSLDEVAVKIGC